MQQVADTAQEMPPCKASMNIAPLPYPEQNSSSPMCPKLLLTSHKIISYVQCLLNISIYFCFRKGENLN